MKYKSLVFAFILSIVLMSLIGFYALNIADQSIKSFEAGNKYFKDNATAATELSSYAKRAEGHLLLYLTLHRASDKDKFPKRIKSMNERVSILDQKLEESIARKILDKIKFNSIKAEEIGTQLINEHDKAITKSGKFNIEQYRDDIWTMHEYFSSLRRSGVELATLEINLEHEVKLQASDNTKRLQFFMLIMIVTIMAITLFLGYILIKTLNSLDSEISNRILSEKIIKQERNKLEDALDQVKTLSGLLPICAECKNIRDDKGYWKQIESYIREHSEAEFSHSICPSCFKKLYPEYQKDDEL